MMLICAHINLRRTRNIFVFNLALADTGTCVVAIWDILYREHVSGILRMEPILNSMLIVSVLSIFAIAVDRYIALKGAPLKHHTMFTVPRVTVACIIIWLFSFAVCTTPFYIPKSHKMISYFFSPIFVLSTLILTAIAYSIILKSLRNSTVCGNLSRHQADVRRRRTQKLLITFTLILVSNFICWVPMCVFLMVEYVKDEDSLSKTFWIASSFSFDLTALNAAINPVCFLWRLPEAKCLCDNPAQEIKYLMCCDRHGQRRRQDSNGSGIYHVSSNLALSARNTHDVTRV